MKHWKLISLLIAVSCLGSFVHAQEWNTNQLSWTAPTTCTSGQPIANCPVTSYRVERSATQAGTYATLGTSTTTSYTHTGAVAGQNCYRVIAVSAQGESLPSNVACKTNVQPSGPPNPPTNLTVQSSVVWDVRANFQSFAFERSSRRNGYSVKIGAACDEDRCVAGGYCVVANRRSITPRPVEGSVLLAKCA